MNAYFTNQLLDELSKEYRTMSRDGEGNSIEQEYNSTAVRGDITKLVSDVKLARKQLDDSEIILATIVNNYHHVLPYDLTQAALKIARGHVEEGDNQ
ncbi:hypothetical protein BSK49_16450 [Paenibacillus odorifer]|jgi:hypothetical protein|uniref:Uncharacterized protein n=1 Tax=Paenibacillus odorifer TaxID=189426 RepID=A0ABX3GWS3_9BACL|nr:hypothetical protein [Paenibacillus odorifer]OMD38514.1 hypothetical protein BSO21_04145 [Paenibacillus odorifer]OMD88236.1 hypothetical protein BSK49_16450 [Paenibacillus odorifer]